jgi:DNA-binding Lrp family transcriptional regulator
MKLTIERLEEEYRSVFELLSENPRVQKRDVARVLGHTEKTTHARMKEAFEKGYIVGPYIRKKSFGNFKQHMCFVKCEDPIESFERYAEDLNVIYHEVIDGFADLRIISKRKFDIAGSVHEGFISDYHISYAQDYSWNKALQIMHREVENFDPRDYQPKGIIKTHWDETVEWDEKDEILFQELKYDFRKPLGPILKKNHIWSGDAYDWLKKLPECCTIYTSFFPKTLSAYDPYIYMFETDYEDFIIDLFSLLPTSSWFFKISDKLFLYMWVERGSMRISDFRKPDISKLQIPILMRDLLKKRIIESKVHAGVQCYWRKGLDDP